MDSLILQNESQLAQAMESLKPKSTSEFEKLVEGVIAAFDEHRATNGGVSEMPSKVSQAMLNRLKNELLIDVAGVQFCQPDSIAWDQSYLYTTEEREVFTIHRMDAPGGDGMTIKMKDESVHDLGKPHIYVSEKFAIPRFEKYYADKWVAIMQAKISEVAADLASQIDADVWTILATQLTTTLNTVGFSHIQARVQDVPSTNDYLAMQSTCAPTKQLIQDIIMHGLKMKRRVTQIFLPTPAMEGIWDFVDENTYHPRISDKMEEYIERTGGTVLNLWGNNIVFQTVNTLNGSPDDGSEALYLWVRYDPIGDVGTVPHGAAFYVSAETPDATTVAAIQYVGTDVSGKGVMPGPWDQYVLKQGLLIVGIDYQKPNIARFRYC